jgi:hypothetical protein
MPRLKPTAHGRASRKWPILLAVGVVVAGAIAPSSRAYSFGGRLAAETGAIGPGAAEDLSCLGATPGMVLDLRLMGEIGSTLDAVGHGHATLNGSVHFSLYSPDPVAAGEPGQLLYTGVGTVHYSQLITEWPAEGFVTTPFESVTFEVRSTTTGETTTISVYLFGSFYPEDGGLALTFGAPRCA